MDLKNEIQKFKGLRWFFLATDIGFILYWAITLVHAIPEEYFFKDYDNPILSAWNWSFLPLDLFISFTGLTSLYLSKTGKKEWRALALVSLALTFASGLQALAFWTIRSDYNWSWWIANGYLLIYPLFYFPKLIRY
ncbi:DUF5360 family protein [Leptospira wolffii]|uniref:DUF5360 family protein n=1 Tax=Leptospira wolffii TaxID=409998 RepID=A0ABV5BL73_9LEPT